MEETFYNNPDNQPQFQNDRRHDYYKEMLPNASTVLTLGIIGIVLFMMLCWCYGLIAIVTLIIGIIGLVMANRSISTYRKNPENYSRSSYKNVSIGRVLSIINVILSGIVCFAFLILLIIFGSLIFENMDEVIEEVKNNKTYNESHEDHDYYENEQYEYLEEVDSLYQEQDAIPVEKHVETVIEETPEG